MRTLPARGALPPPARRTLGVLATTLVIAGCGRGDQGDVDRVSPELHACLTRNDDVLPWADPANEDLPEMKAWHSEGRQTAHEYIFPKIEHYLADENEHDDGFKLRHGLVNYDLDPMNNRLIFQVDSTMVDIAKFQDWVDKAATAASRAVKVRGAPLRVTVQPSCFPAAEVRRLTEFLNTDHANVRYTYDSEPDLRGRVGIDVSDDEPGREFGTALREQFGALVDVTYRSG